jgi:hypothetical protein
MSKKSLNIVKVPKKMGLKQKLVFKPNYILRKKDAIPVIHGLSNNPTYDYFFSFNFKSCKEIIFSE